MKENTNKALLFNSIFLYARMIICTVCAVFTTRFSLQALGFDDFGLFSLLGGIITFISLFNTAMLSTSNRFIAVAIGKKDEQEVNVQFNVNLRVHLLIAVITALLALPLGNIYIHFFVNYSGDMTNAYLVFNISVIASILSFLGVPYNGFLMAHEKFPLFSVMEIICHVARLLMVWFLIYHFSHKLLAYTLIYVGIILVPILVYVAYSHRHYPDSVRIGRVGDRNRYKDVFSFSNWVLLGAVCSIARSQGSMLVVNGFFNTVMNSSLGIANSINSYIMSFAQSVAQPMAPQITKSYSSGDIKRTNDLLVMSTKYSFLVMFLVSVPFMAEPDWLLTLWLGKVPPYANLFVVLMIVDNLIQSFNSGIGNVIFASGKIQKYQLWVSFLNIFSLVLGYLMLSLWNYAVLLLVAYIIVSVVKVFILQYVLHTTLNYENSILLRRSYIPCITITMLFLPSLYLFHFDNPLVTISISMIYIILLEFFIGLSESERKVLSEKVGKFMKK